MITKLMKQSKVNEGHLVKRELHITEIWPKSSESNAVQISGKLPYIFWLYTALIADKGEDHLKDLEKESNSENISE